VLHGGLIERMALSVGKDQAKETFQLVDKVGTRSVVINNLIFETDVYK